MTKCRICKAPYAKTSMAHVVCSPSCAIALVQQKKAKVERKNIRARREQLKTRRDWLKTAQAAFNAWIRARDINLPCISCGRYHQGQWHAGHYRTTAAAPQVRFHPDNVHKQCQPCNTHKSGNVVEYRINLVKRIGIERVEFLECANEITRYTIEELKAITIDYRKRTKALMGAR